MSRLVYTLNNLQISKESLRASPKPEKKNKPIWSFTVDELKFNKACVFHVVNEENE